ncbi:GNAT family N-acetyltransferase, partial [archaeon]|nr:GNAT family N-acetyltransferase [archaeon]
LEGTHLVLIENDKVIGMVVAPDSNMNPNITEISYLAVKEREKGKGTKLISELKKICKEKKKRSIITYSRSAVDFYKKQGFKKITEDSKGSYLFLRLE